MSDLIEVHAVACGHERTDTLISALGGNTAALEWAIRKDLERKNQTYTLTAEHAAHPATLTADTLDGLLPLIEEYAGPHTPEFSYQTGQGHIWWDDQETGFTDNGGDDAVNVGGDPEEGEIPEWVHAGPKPATIDAVRAYAAHVLDAHPRNIEIRED